MGSIVFNVPFRAETGTSDENVCWIVKGFRALSVLYELHVHRDLTYLGVVPKRGYFFVVHEKY